MCGNGCGGFGNNCSWILIIILLLIVYGGCGCSGSCGCAVPSSGCNNCGC